ncbi:MAG: hydroxymethylbilane synthase [Vicinamibacterales bacterium]
MRALRLGTRGSPLALWQARRVAALLEARGTPVEVLSITTQGDRRQDVPLPDIGGKRVFVKEIDEALLSGAIDLAVHSAKDMAAESAPGLRIAATLPREDPRDAIVLGARSRFPQVERLFPPAALEHRELTPSIGTGSVRRIALLSRALPGATFTPVRGNVDTRLRKLDAGDMDAIILAAAGLNRLGLGGRISCLIPVETCVPAPGQGIIAIEVRNDDEPTRARVCVLNDDEARIALRAEQALVAALGGGCQLPLGAYASIGGGSLVLRAVVASVTGEEVLSTQLSGKPVEAAALGRQAAVDLDARGARRILHI